MDSRRRPAREEGVDGLKDRSSRPHRSPTALPTEWKEAVKALRRLRFTQAQIAQILQLSPSRGQRTVSEVELGKLSGLDPKEPENRYERKRPGELVHVDTKRLARFFQPRHRVTDRSDRRLGGRRGYEFLHVAIDDRTRPVYAELLPDETGERCADFLCRAARIFSRNGIGRIERVMSDNGSGYVSKTFKQALLELGAKHKRTMPYTPRTNGKAERMISSKEIGAGV